MHCISLSHLLVGIVVYKESFSSGGLILCTKIVKMQGVKGVFRHSWRFLISFFSRLFSLLKLPESSRGMEGSAEGSSCRLRCQISGKRRDRFGVVTRVICKLDCNGLCGALWDSSVQLLNCPLSFDSLIETDETDTFGQAFKMKEKGDGT